MGKVVRLDVMRAMARPADVRFEVEFWRLEDGRWWCAPYALTSQVGPLSPKDVRMFGHAVVDDGNNLWDQGGAPRPPKRKAVKRRRGRR